MVELIQLLAVVEAVALLKTDNQVHQVLLEVTVNQQQYQVQLQHILAVAEVHTAEVLVLEVQAVVVILMRVEELVLLEQQTPEAVEVLVVKVVQVQQLAVLAEKEL